MENKNHKKNSSLKAEVTTKEFENEQGINYLSFYKTKLFEK